MPFQIIRNDITKVHADAIVNTANPEPIYASGTDAAIYQAAGARKLLAERKKIGRLRPGEAAVTPAFRLRANYIIHTVGPVWIDGNHGEFSTLASCYRKSLLLARQLGCRSIAFPLIATGVYGFPKDKALEIALKEFTDFLQIDEAGYPNEAGPSGEAGSSGEMNSSADETGLSGEANSTDEAGLSDRADSSEEDTFEEEEMNITLVVFDRRAFDLSSGLVESVRQYIDENYVDEQRVKEYGDPYGSEGPYAQERRIIEQQRRRNLYRPSSSNLPDTLAEDTDRQESIRKPRQAQGSRPKADRVESSRPEAGRVESPRSGADRVESSRPEAGRRRGTGALEDLLHRLRDRDRRQPADGGLDGGIPQIPQLEEELAEYELTLEDLPAPSALPQEGYREDYREETAAQTSSVPSPRSEPFLYAPTSQSPRPRRSLDDVMAQVGESFQECLLRMIDERGLKDSSVYKRANIDRKLFSKIRCNPDYTPGRRTAIALGIALELNMDEMTDLLRKAGIALSPGSKFDLIIRYCVENHIYNIIEINTILFDYDQAQLG